MKPGHSDNEQTRLDCGANGDSGSLSRRCFLLNSGAALTTGVVAVTVPPSLAGDAARESTRPGFTAKQHQILTAVTGHLLPASADSPGATEINAVPYLERAIFRPGFAVSTRRFIINRAQTLEEASRERFERVFAALDSAQRETLLRYVEEHTRWGSRWISSLLSYILEALLADPVYGGNPDGVGWKWLEHQPGFPTPPPHKTYMRILADL